MGNSFAKAKEDDIADIRVDEGQVIPFKDGVYPNSPQDWDIQVVKRLIVERRMSPFYKGLAEMTDKPEIAPTPTPPVSSGSTSRRASVVPEGFSISARDGLAWTPARRTSHDRQPSSSSSSTFSLKGKRSVSMPSQLVAQESLSLIRAEDLYKYPIECPICFLYYPANVNYSRCCDQPICTECFVQIKRPEATLEPASCPFCVEANFGILYHPPGSPEYKIKLMEAYPEAFKEEKNGGPAHGAGGPEQKEMLAPPLPPVTSKRRQSVSHKSALVVTSDDLRPDWLRKQQQLALVRAANQRRMTFPLGQHGGSSSRRRMLDPDRDLSGAAAAAAALVESMTGVSPQSGSSRSRRSGHDTASQRRRPPRDRLAGGDLGMNYLEAMRNMGADLEELMIMEAIRRSLQEAETNNEDENSENTPQTPVPSPATPDPSASGVPAAQESEQVGSAPLAVQGHHRSQ
ncbi:uncharacterized protein SPPG_06016 [Spizellomyces punctatus DAOM BR117]|uniref:RING-type domain-containing protein n=1 Tax=Spizellomyces punctatus (strain DAOM BR117) TaxID=645134 RepID=A0A0L0HD80_SPIPD|nr:uncharacterized protein SPPG_06016 [Spizellomyces punctatus DAOM BR117]KNC99067.1 hypothetical protein SPPG_06016 [Spizellomyces punctatus DAOM BR117]|eukprot:XP_016607107.1 hypothetical protein SPPG_06016 [Spizellomyces punctatus DAOM BR117]